MGKHIFSTVWLITFLVFMVEAIMHYNMGYRRSHKNANGFVFPPKNDLLKLAFVVGIFSLLNGFIVKQVTKAVKG